MTKQQAMKALRKSAAWKQMSQQHRAIVNGYSAADLGAFLKEMGIQGQVKSRASRGKGKSRKSTAAQRRSRAIAKAIKAGAVAAKQGKHSAADMQGKTAKQKAAKFVKLYKGVRIASRKSRKKGVTRKSIKKIYAQIQGQKHPYFLEKGFVSRVGGGPSGPGVIRKIHGHKVKPYGALSQAQQQSVVSFLDSQKGKKLRGPGAKKKAARSVGVGEIFLRKSRAQRKSRKSASRKSRASRRQHAAK